MAKPEVQRARRVGNTRRTVKGRGAKSRHGLQMHQRRARSFLRYRRASVLAISLTAILLLIVSGDPALTNAQQDAANGSSELENPQQALFEAGETVEGLVRQAFSFLPKLGIALAILLAFYFFSKLAAFSLRRSLANWRNKEAASALIKIGFWILGIATAFSVLAGDVRALLGSVGLVGLALSWALQTPIESFTGWLLNSFQRYYRVGDRIEVGEVFGDVFRIDVLTTTVWEAGGPGKSVAGAQSTGALITFPNWEVLRSNIVNYTQDFPYVWDEITIGLTNESDLLYALEVYKTVTRQILGPEMSEAADSYQQILRRSDLAFEIEEEPQIYVSPASSWTDLTIRYLVPVRARRRVATQLHLAIQKESSHKRHNGKIVSAYPRQEVRLSQGSEFR